MKIHDHLETLPIDDLVPYARNSRTHSHEQVAQIAASIREFGFTNPVLVDEGGGIIAGHGRVMAARMLNVERVPCLRLAGLSAEQKRAYVIADNRLALNAGWDEDLLAAELKALNDLDFDLDLLGFDEAEIAEILHAPDPAGHQADPDKAPATSETATSRRGDIWILGNHRLKCGDSTNADDVTALLGGAKADVVFTDPPYGVNVQGGKNNNTIAGDLTQTAIPFSFDLAVNLATKGDARLYFCGGEGNLYLYQKLFERHCRQLPRHLIWVKNGFTMKPNGYHNQYEIIFHGYKAGGGSLKHWYGERTEDHASDIWRIARDAASTYLHPTQKPVAIAARAIGNSCPPGGIVYEPFSGSGSTLVAAESTGRRCYAMELDPLYVDVAVRRWQAYTNRQATLESTGEAFPA